MNPWYFRCHSVTAQKGSEMAPWLVWWVWCWCGNTVERLHRLEGVNILKGRVRAECMEWSHVAAENTGEHRRMLGMKFYVTLNNFCKHQNFIRINPFAFFRIFFFCRITCKLHKHKQRSCLLEHKKILDTI